ncbi:unnamed protein product [Bursaphelenchus okinawaensis]|uniref:PITH domain-containing protein n=1 Tax=Bursaphelenchus okinawaensis TaxID=465554 RepID=A0A811KN88_9BILA|nr:unnamed protein product [Bursaphelenchus okinawaensis]CAG9106570.1 unnamed protein product [Bursaphelenchus okinawaensis]
MCDHGHSHSDCGSQAVVVETADAEAQYNMAGFIDKDKVNVLNEEEEGSGVQVLKVWSERFDKTKSVTSDVDEELLFNLPFTGHVKLTGIVLIGEDGEMHPARLRIFKDRENMSFEDVTAGKPDQEVELKVDTEGRVDYPLISTKFSNIYYLTLHFPKNFGAEQTRIYYIGLRGSFQHGFREKVAIATYEARPMPDDHKANTRDQVQRHVF